MTNTNSTSEELSDVIKQLRLEQEKLEKELATVEKHIRAVETTINLIRKNERPAKPEQKEDFKSDLKGKKLLEALMHITSESNGLLKVSHARQVMLEVGLLKNPKNALSILYTVMNRSGKFEKINRGEYRVISQPSSPLTSPSPEVPFKLDGQAEKEEEKAGHLPLPGPETPFEPISYDQNDE